MATYIYIYMPLQRLSKHPPKIQPPPAVHCFVLLIEIILLAITLLSCLTFFSFSLSFIAVFPGPRTVSDVLYTLNKISTNKWKSPMCPHLPGQSWQDQGGTLSKARPIRTFLTGIWNCCGNTWMWNLQDGRVLASGPEKEKSGWVREGMCAKPEGPGPTACLGLLGFSCVLYHLIIRFCVLG